MLSVQDIKNYVPRSASRRQGAILSANGTPITFRNKADNDIQVGAIMGKMARMQASGKLSLKGSADFLVPGGIGTNRYQDEITDVVRRRYSLGKRISYVPATGDPSRYFDQTTIVQGAFTPKTAIAPAPGTPTRNERYATLKALVAQINYGLFQVEVSQQQGQFAYLVAKDLMDTVEGTLTKHDYSLWNGNDTFPVSTTDEYSGLLTQITRTFTIRNDLVGNSIVDLLKAEVASMLAQTGFKVVPTAIYGNPILLDRIDREERSLQRHVREVEVTAGVYAPAIATGIGVLPLISEPALIGTSPGAGGGTTTDYPLVIVSEPLVEYHYLTTPNPRVFLLGLVSNLATQHVVAMFGAPVAKMAANAHSVGTVTITN